MKKPISAGGDMGRGRRRRRYIAEELPDDKIDIEKIEDQKRFVEFADSETSVSAQYAYQMGFIGYDERGELIINRDAVKKEIDYLRRVVVTTREEPKEQFIKTAREATGNKLGDRAIMNATNRDFQARARVAMVAARLADVPVTAADKRVLNPLSRGEFIDVVYGKEGRYDKGTLQTRWKAASKGGRTRDPSARARAQDRLKYLKGQEYRENWVA